MKPRFSTILNDLFPDSSPEFAAIADAWPQTVINQMLDLVWSGFDRVRALPNFKALDFTKDYMQLERSLTELHAQEVTLLFAERHSGFESFIPMHEPWEFANLSAPSARPPSGDIGFVLRHNRRLRWSVEGKVVETATDTSRYLGDLTKFLGAKNAPLAVSSALGAYLKQGLPEEFFSALETGLSHKPVACAAFSGRPHRLTRHRRPKATLQAVTPEEFLCHHMVFSLS